MESRLTKMKCFGATKNSKRWSLNESMVNMMSTIKKFEAAEKQTNGISLQQCFSNEPIKKTEIEFETSLTKRKEYIGTYVVTGIKYVRKETVGEYEPNKFFVKAATRGLAGIIETDGEYEPNKIFVKASTRGLARILEKETTTKNCKVIQPYMKPVVAKPVAVAASYIGSLITASKWILFLFCMYLVYKKTDVVFSVLKSARKGWKSKGGPPVVLVTPHYVVLNKTRKCPPLITVWPKHRLF